ncbi:phosphomannomutase [Halothiobacillus neapolitanus]|nr:phosphomannomutase [Halothiobacillus neapolitanus]
MGALDMDLTCFKAYDIRGQVPAQLDAELAYRIGRAFVDEINPGTVVVGYDVRLESPMLAEALMRGITEAGADVIDIGLCGTEEVYFQTFHREAQGVGGGIMVTASHNPKGYNGMKLVREGARPVSGDTGLFAIRDSIANPPSSLAGEGGLRQLRVGGDEWRHDARADSTPSPLVGEGWGEGENTPKPHGKITTDTNKAAYIQHLLGYIDHRALKPLKIVADPGNGGAGPVMRLLEKHLPFDIHYIHEQPDGNFPNGVPNPLLPEMRDATSQAVIEQGADLGIAWDGDFDRCFLFDAKGRFIEGYYLVGLLAETLLAKHPGGKIIHDPRLTWNTIEQVEQAGGIPIQSKTGHAFIKQIMREQDAIYGGEMSAHHYFRDFGYCDSGMIPWLLITELMSKTGKTLAELVDERMAAYPCSGEINYRIDDVQGTIDRVLAHFSPMNPKIDRTDGVSVEFDDWRFNLRGSNTEPLLRLNVETRSDSLLLERQISVVENLIGKDF